MPLLRRTDVMERIVAEVRYDARVRSREGGERQRVGYVGHLRWICTDLWSAFRGEVRSTLSSIDGWTEVVMSEIEAVEQLQSQPLGGPPPEEAASSAGGSPYLHKVSEFDCISAVQTAMASLN